MVKKILILISLFLLFSFTVNAECTSDWSCTEWSKCSVVNYNTRNCVDNNKCSVSTNSPIQIKKCDDTNLYPANEVITTKSDNEEVKPVTISSNEENIDLANVDDNNNNLDNDNNDNSSEVVESNLDENNNETNSSNQNQELNNSTPKQLIGLFIILGFVIFGIVIGIIIRKISEE
jgi:hypothetical protein